MIKRTTFLLFVLCSICTASHQLRSQDTLNSRYGIFGHGLAAIHTADFRWLPNTASCCSGFTGGTSIGIGTGILFEFPIANNILFGTRLSLISQPFSMTTREPIDNIIVNGVGQKGAFDHKLDGSYSTVTIEPVMSYRLFGAFFVNAGLSVGKMVSSNYKQLQQISEPAGAGTFLDENGNDSRKRTRNEFSGELPHPSFIISPMIGASIELPLNKKRTMLLSPEILYQIGVSDIIEGVNWKTNLLRLGISIKYSPQDEKPIPILPIQEKKKEAPVIAAETPQQIETKPTVRIVAVGLDANGREVSSPTLRIEEFTSTVMTSLLNYVFFAPNSAEIQQRYSLLTPGQAGSFTPEKVNSTDKLSTYYHLLNIIGKRMQLNPVSKITLTGCINDYAEEKNNLGLAKKRAETVKEYITKTWNIQPDRIIIEERLLPSKPSNMLTSDGADENRRVEITTESEEILAPIITNDTLRTANYSAIRFKPIVPPQIDCKKWSIAAEQNSKVIKNFQAVGVPPHFVDWRISSEKTTIPRFATPLQFELSVTDNSNTVVRDKGEIQIDAVSISKKRTEKQGDKEIDSYSLILFGVKSADLTPVNKSIIELIKKRIKQNASVVVMGYTDRVGEITFNLSLADTRAKAVANFLGKSYDISTVAKGNSNLYDNNLPEGRFYSRTVEIEVQTPVTY